ncbi:MAG: glycoside hydrolase family 47 protein [Candidatus Eisenbacteria bacterium]|nr:glycoside hydrolase family 47 protein [Candidatus Eisenbacteria bacterium]
MRIVAAIVLVALLAAPAAAERPRNTPAPPSRPGIPAPAITPAERAALADSVRAEFAHAWGAYAKTAWGHDDLRPVSGTWRDWYGEPVLMTPVDALDALILLGFDADADRVRRLIEDKLTFDRDTSVQVFEVTIRLLGGLLSSYQMTGDVKLLKLADDLGTRMLPAFDSPTGMPYRFVNLHTGRVSGARSNPAEVGTLLLEFGTLSKLTHRPVFYDKAKRALVELYSRRSRIGLVGDEIDVESGAWVGRASHVGGGIDSYYEYLLKCWRLFGDADCERMWRSSVAAMNTYLADDSAGVLWYGESDMDTGRRSATTFGALHAFLPAVLALGGDLDRARRLEDSAYRMWNLYGIEPEVIDYRTMTVVAPGYPLRPEIMESAFYLSRTTHDPRYLEMARTFFHGLVARCRVAGGYTGLRNVVTGEQADLMHSFFLAETLKYLYLTFAPDQTLDLDQVVFNTEAHPLRRTW